MRQSVKVLKEYVDVQLSIEEGILTESDLRDYAFLAIEALEGYGYEVPSDVSVSDLIEGIEYILENEKPKSLLHKALGHVASALRGAQSRHLNLLPKSLNRAMRRYHRNEFDHAMDKGEHDKAVHHVIWSHKHNRAADPEHHKQDVAQAATFNGPVPGTAEHAKFIVKRGIQVKKEMDDIKRSGDRKKGTSASSPRSRERKLARLNKGDASSHSGEKDGGWFV